MNGYIYIDVESGTILNGPIVAVSYEKAEEIDFELMGDSDIIEKALEVGRNIVVVEDDE